MEEMLIQRGKKDDHFILGLLTRWADVDATLAENQPQVGWVSTVQGLCTRFRSWRLKFKLMEELRG